MEGHLSNLLRTKGTAVYTVSPDATVRAAVHQMNEKGVGALLVLEGTTPAGIFTERDVLRRVVAAGLDPDATTVGQVMTTEIVTAMSSMRVEEAMGLMADRRLRHLPIVDDGEVVGLISIGDLNQWAHTHLEDAIRSYDDYITGRSEHDPRVQG